MPTFGSFLDHNTSQRYQDAALDRADPEILGALGDLVKLSIIIIFFFTNLEAKVCLCNFHQKQFGDHKHSALLRIGPGSSR